MYIVVIRVGAAHGTQCQVGRAEYHSLPATEGLPRGCPALCQRWEDQVCSCSRVWEYWCEYWVIICLCIHYMYVADLLLLAYGCICLYLLLLLMMKFSLSKAHHLVLSQGVLGETCWCCSCTRKSSGTFCKVPNYRVSCRTPRYMYTFEWTKTKSICSGHKR